VSTEKTGGAKESQAGPGEKGLSKAQRGGTREVKNRESYKDEGRKKGRDGPPSHHPQKGSLGKKKPRRLTRKRCRKEAGKGLKGVEERKNKADKQKPGKKETRIRQPFWEGNAPHTQE